MYKLPRIIEKYGHIDFKAFPIPNQDKIKSETGSPLDLAEAFDTIVAISDNFKKHDELAQEADALLSTLIENKFDKEKELMEPSEDQEPTKQDYQDALEALKVMLETTDPKEAAEMGIIDAIEAIETMLSLM